ncbi:MAG: NAD-dependent epimerase/dehydratase family protein, partial [Verrucomicrobia bacterium]|nr:NAD-dependent epimerase/dehydratase family protein [Verrucomicrobiota bacterium]
MTADNASPSLLLVGCGFLGEATADFFHARGWRVTAWTGSAASAARLAALKPYPVEPSDISRPDLGRENPASAAGGWEVVIQCVAGGRGGGAETYRRVYLDGARHLLAALRPARFIFVGSTSVYAQTDGAWVDETSPAEPARETGRVLRETETHVLAHPGGTVARLAGLYGPRRSVLLKKFLAGEAVIEGDGSRWLNQIHRDDAAAALWHLAHSPVTAGIFNVADDTPLTQLALYHGLSERLGRPLPPSAPPDFGRKRGWTSKRV